MGPRPRFGANSFNRTDDTNGIPTYSAAGHLRRDELAEPKVANMMLKACPAGNPRLLYGNVMWYEGQPGKTWVATFTCDQVIPDAK